MADERLPMNGKDSKLELFYGGARVPSVDGHILQWNVEEVAVMFRDGILGRKRKRTDKTVDGYNADLGEVLCPDMALVNFLKGIDDTREAGGTLKDLDVGIRMSRRDAGGTESVILKKCTAKWKLTSSAQSERIKVQISLEGEDYKGMTI